MKRGILIVVTAMLSVENPVFAEKPRSEEIVLDPGALGQTPFEFKLEAGDYTLSADKECKFKVSAAEAEKPLVLASKCDGSAEDRPHIELHKKSVADLRAATLRSKKLEFTFALPGGRPMEISWKDTPSAISGAKKIIYFSDGEWHSATPSAFLGLSESQFGDSLKVWVLGEDNKYQHKEIKKSLVVKSDKVTDAPADMRENAEARCVEDERAHRNERVFCFYHDQSWFQLPTHEDRGEPLPPNTRVRAIAVGPPGHEITLDLSGEFGLTDPSVRSETIKADGKATSGQDRTKKVELVVRTRAWAFPKPGMHTLTVTLKKLGEEAKPGDSIKVDLSIEEAYAGAIRVGVGAVFGGARDRTFSAQALPGSGQMEITTTDGGMLDAELVLGAAAFLDSGGRTYFSGVRRHWAPYFGIGLLNQTNTGFELLKSLHLGLEYEISKQFSIAFTVVGRRVTRLADGLEVGDPVSAATVPTRTGYEIGAAVVFNLSPEFLKLGKSPSSGFFK